MAKARASKKGIGHIVDPTVHETDVEVIESDEDSSLPGLVNLPKEVSDIVLETVNTEVARLDQFEDYAKVLVQKYSGVTIKDISDKAGYENVRVAIGDLRKIRVSVMKNRKIIKAPFLDACTKIDQRAASIVKLVDELEGNHNRRKDEIDNEIEQVKADKKRAEEQRAFNRIAELVKMGAVSTTHDGMIHLGDASVEMQKVRDLEDEAFNNEVLPKFRDALQQLEKDKIEVENKRLADLQQLELDKQKLIDDQKLFEQQKEAFKKQQDEQDNKIKEEADRKAAAAKKLLLEKTTARGNVLMEIGMTYNLFEDGYKYNDILISITDLQDWNDEDFDRKVNALTPAIASMINEAAQLAEAQRQGEIKIATDKALADAEAKRLEEAEKKKVADEADKKRKADDLAKAGDKVKWADFIDKLSQIKVPKVSSGIYIKKRKTAEVLLGEIFDL